MVLISVIEGDVWCDPPEYWEKVIWPAYIHAHKHILEGEDIMGNLNGKVKERVLLESIEGQYVDGLCAPLVLHRSQELYKYDKEFTVVLGDWYHEEHPVLLKQFINTDNPNSIEPVPDSAIIYFVQGTWYLSPKAGASPSPVTATVGFNESATLPFEPGRPTACTLLWKPGRPCLPWRASLTLSVSADQSAALIWKLDP
ncbi:hypothetical protein D9758_015420 [Tetrapyrgos nigripes]|uniref:Uncharacterized protein n=1 Tax=Tetrapyrgos nigripes TaxID=182062 RepID=A0A8H5FNI1_9AGAR|nr:hypothetical protein D9758_015420 [Tetrapyrgos nigripes]